MGDSWRDWFQSWVDPGAPAHPNSPWGGGGRGGFTTRDPLGLHLGPTIQPFPLPGDVILPIPHPSSPAARTFDWHRLPVLDQAERVYAVLTALLRARHHVAGELLKATGEELLSIVEGLIPGLLLSLGVVAVTTLAGAAAGALLGALAFGVGAAPGAMAGAAAGAEAGLAILEYLGVAFLAAFVAKSMLEATRLSLAAAEVAWHSVEHPATADAELDRSAHLFARAVAEVFRGILQGIVAYLIKEGIGAAKARMPELVAKLRASRLGESFAKWVEANWERLVRNKKLQPGAQAAPPEGGAPGQGGGAAGGGGAPAGGKAPAEGGAAPRPATTGEPPPRPKTASEKLAENRAAARERERSKILKEKIAAADKQPPMDPADEAWLKADPRHKELAIDPEGDGQYRIEEAKAALRAEGKPGGLTPPVRRALRSVDEQGGMDFIDGGGKLWDHKSATMGARDIATTVQRGENVLVDCEGMTPDQVADLQREVAARLGPGASEVKYIP
jgi:hypothetical protein